MGLFDLYGEQANTGAPSPLTALPRTAGERFEAEFEATQAPDRYFNITGARRDMWQRAIDGLSERTGESFANPYDFAPKPEEMTRLGNQPAITEERRNRIIEASRMARANGADDLFDPENIDRYIGEEATRRREKAASYEGTGRGFAGFLGGTAGETLTPHGALGLMIPVTRLPMAVASTVGRTFLGNVAREALFQAGANTALQAGAEALDYAARSEIGTQQAPEEIAGNLLGAAVTGAVVGGGLRALHLGWLRLTERARTQAPLEVKDAFTAIEADVLYSGRNRLGIDPLLHERYQSDAAVAALRGMPLNLPADEGRTALTALGTILRQDVDQPIISGLGETLGRVGHLPDGDIEAFARELRPQSFVAYDRITTELEKAKGRIAELDRSLERVTVADLVDPLTGARLADIEERLGAKALSRREREQLEYERDMIVQSVDREGTLGADLKRAREEVQTVAEREERGQLQERIGTLEAEMTHAQGEVGREIEFLRGKIETAASRFMGGREAVAGAPSPARSLAADLGIPAEELGAMLDRSRLLQERRVRRDAGISDIPDVDTPTKNTVAEARGRAAQYIEEPPKPDDPELAKAVDVETQRILADSTIPADLRDQASRDLLAANRDVRDAAAAADCALGGAHL